MGTLHEAYWASTGYGPSHRQGQSGSYRWFLPSGIANSNPALSCPTVALVATASERLSKAPENRHAYTDRIARMLLRSEAVGSSHIKGLVISSKRLLRAELHDLDPDNVRYDANAAAVLGSIRAMEKARELALNTTTFDVAVLRRVHAELCRGTEIEPYGGVVRNRSELGGRQQLQPTLGRVRAPCSRGGRGAARGPRGLYQPRRRAHRSPSGRRPCSVRVDPSLCRWERPLRTCAYPDSAAAAGSPNQRHAADLASPCHRKRRLPAGPRRIPALPLARRGGRRAGRHAGRPTPAARPPWPSPPGPSAPAASARRACGRTPACPRCPAPHRHGRLPQGPGGGGRHAPTVTR